MENQSEDEQTTPVPAARKGGRKRVYTDEERQEARKEAVQRFAEKNPESFKNTRKKATEKYIKNYRNSSFPLVELENGQFQCTVCSKVVSSHYVFKIHEKSKRHSTALETTASS